MTHEIKCWPQYFQRVVEGVKTFEVRENDRGYQPGDDVIMKEWDPKIIERLEDTRVEYITIREHKGYTGRSVKFKIGYVYPLDEKRVVFSILELK